MFAALVVVASCGRSARNFSTPNVAGGSAEGGSDGVYGTPSDGGEPGSGSAGVSGLSGSGGSAGMAGVGGTTSPPSATCGDGRVTDTGADPEACDDGNLVSDDGCSKVCQVEPGWACEGEPSTCADADECTLYTDDCSPSAACRNTEGGFTCACNDGFSGDGVTCDLRVPSLSLGANHSCAVVGGAAVCCGAPTTMGSSA